MNQDINTLNNINIELKLALEHFIGSIQNSGPLANQVENIKSTLKSNEAIFALSSLVEQYAKMKKNIDELEKQDSESDLNILLSLMKQSASKNLATNQAEKITEILSEINLQQPFHSIMVTVGRALESFANDLSVLRDTSNVIVTREAVKTEETDVVASDVYLASKKLIKEVVVISKQLTQTYPNDQFIGGVLHEASKMPSGKGSFFKSIDLLERTTNYLALLIQQERCSAEEMLNNIHTHLVGVFKQTSIIDSLISSTKDTADKITLSMVTELKNMEVKAKGMNTLEDMQKHINESVLLMSNIMNNYSKTQNKLHQTNSKTINDLTSKVNEAATYIEKLDKQLNIAEEKNLIDELTGLGNHRGYVQTISKEREAWLASKLPLALIILDIDRFKNINDNFGHSIGDQVIKSLAQTLKNKMRSSDYIARYGGEEFIIILPDTDLNKATLIAKKLRELVNNLQFELRKKNKKLKVTCSFGVASFTKKTSKTIDVFNAVDKALYRAKENGRDDIVVSLDDKLISIDK